MLISILFNTFSGGQRKDAAASADEERAYPFIQHSALTFNALVPAKFQGK